MANEDRRSEIYAEVGRLKDTAQKMREIASGLKKLADEDYANSLSEIKECWTGDNAGAFLAKAQKAGVQTAAAARELFEAADTLETIAANYADTELKAVKLALS